MSRRPVMSRYERIRQGLPVCAVEGCSRVPAKRGHCREDYDKLVKQRRGKIGPGAVSVTFDMSGELVAAVRHAAQVAGVSFALWAREALARALTQPTSNSGNVSGGPST